MNRVQAEKLINQYVEVDEEEHGSYAGILQDVIAPPKKPWIGKVLVVGITQAPALNETEQGLLPLLYEKEEVIDVKSSKIKYFSGSFPMSYRESFANALKRCWDEEADLLERSEHRLSLIQQELRKWQMEHVLQGNAYVYYHFVKNGESLSIYDNVQADTLILEGCPFEFEIQSGADWIPAYYLEGMTFETASGEKLIVKDGDPVRLNKDQFDPYKMFINELDSPALTALEKGLSKLGLGHEHCVYCHNSLLIQLLSSFDQKDFQGVNFISYSTGSNQILVQHHYSRKMNNNQEDFTSDRFEFTTDSGIRSITAYTTHVSQE